MTTSNLIDTRNEFQDQARKIRHGSAGLSGDALRDAQDQHRRLMGQISQLNQAILNRNH